MEPSYRLITPLANRSLIFKYEAFDLTTRWHYHPEIELIYFTEGITNGVMGEGFREFKAGDLVILGSNFPHVLQENTEFRQQSPEVKPFGLIIQFLTDFLGRDFFQKSEFQHIGHLLERCRRGIQFGGTAVNQVRPQLELMPSMSQTARILTLLAILDTLSESKDYQYLMPEGYYFNDSNDENRMRQVNEYTYRHFTNHISIADIAAVAHLSPTAFCRYFKGRTLKTYTHYLNEIRVAYASKLLRQNQKSITEVCFESGFNNLSYFNRQFRKIMGISPLQFVKQKHG
ncbi:MAG: AraC family transcriptional regulator [Runella sp.]